MVRPISIVGVVLSFVAGSSALAVPRSEHRVKSIAPTWASASILAGDVRRVPCSGICDALREPPKMVPASMDQQSIRRVDGPAVLDRPEVVKRETRSPVKEKQRVGNEAWEVRIYNDGLNTREFVARCLVQIVGLSEMIAYQTMMQAHQNGIAVVGRYVYERAEMYHDALKKSGIICDLVPVDEDV